MANSVPAICKKNKLYCLGKRMSSRIRKNLCKNLEELVANKKFNGSINEVKSQTVITFLAATPLFLL